MQLINAAKVIPVIHIILNNDKTQVLQFGTCFMNAYSQAAVTLYRSFFIIINWTSTLATVVVRQGSSFSFHYIFTASHPS